MATKSCHLEVAHDLTTPAFLAALSRFAARRGCPTEVYCDNGTNFVGGAASLKVLLDPLHPDVLRFSREQHLTFKMISPGSPFMGGLWEAAVKSAKSHLKRTIGLTVLILEEFQTLCCRIEAMLNSRPLTPMSNDPNDLQPLTPGHFLIGRPLVSLVERMHEDDELPRLHRWQLVSGMAQSFWRRWYLEYLSTLQPRQKWFKDPPKLEVNTMVLIHEPNVAPLNWRLGRILQVFPGKDGRVRVADVKTATGVLKRPIQKLYPLPPQD